MIPIKIEISPDQLEARISITARGADFPGMDRIREKLREHGIVFGIDEGLLEKIVREKKPLQGELIARGITAAAGKDASLRWHTGTDPTVKPDVSELSRVDFKKTHLFEKVDKNKPLVSIIEATAGEPGRTVLGEDVVLKGKDIQLPRGRNTILSDDGLALIAEISGSVFYENGMVNVDEVYHISGDVNYGTGNVKFDGPVVIEGDVRSGFRVEARDSIYIGGNVEASSIYSQNGDVTIRYGVLGKNRAKILAGGTLKCGYLQAATVGVRGDVIIDHYSIDSTITAGGKIVLQKNEGLVRGGSVTAERGIRMKTAGSAKNTNTEIKIRSNTTNHSQSKLWDLSRKRAELTVRLSTLNKRLSFLNLLENRSTNLSVERKREKGYVAGEIQRLNERITELDREELYLQKEASKENISREIVVTDDLYPNVHIDISGTCLLTEQQLEAVKLYIFKEEIIIESLRAMDDNQYDIFIPQQN